MNFTSTYPGLVTPHIWFCNSPLVDQWSLFDIIPKITGSIYFKEIDVITGLVRMSDVFSFPSICPAMENQQKMLLLIYDNPHYCVSFLMFFIVDSC